MRKLLLLLGLVWLSLDLLANGSPFTSTTTGNWNDGATWGNSAGGTAGVQFPGAGDVATVDNGATVTIPASFSATITTLTVNAGSTLVIASTGSLALNGLLTMADDGEGGFGTMTISGTLTANQGSSFSGDSSGNTTITSTGKYSHNFVSTAGNIIQATWSNGSTCEVIGYNSNTTPPGNLGQSFHHFTWNCPNPGTAGTGSIDLAGTLTDVAGNLTVSATGGGSRLIRLFGTTSNNSLTVGGNMTIDGSGRVTFSSTGTNNSISIGGTLSVSNNVASTSTISTSGSTTVNVVHVVMNPTAATTLAMASLAGGSSILNISGNFTMSPSAASSLTMSTTTTSSGTINLLGNFSINANSTLATAATAGNGLNFNSSTVQTFSNAGTIQKVNYTVGANATLDVGTSVISGTGSFTLNGGLRVGSTDASGPLQLNTTAGNLRTPTGTRTFASGSTVTYNGSLGQTIGDGHPTGTGVTTRINNTSNVSLSASLVIVGTIILDAGNLAVGSNTLTMNGTFTPNSNSLVTTTASNISIGGTGSLGGNLTFTGSTTIKSFTLNRTSGGTVTLGSDLIIGSAGGSFFTQTAGTLVLNGHTLTIGNDITQSGGSSITVDAASSLIINGAGTLPASISLVGSAVNTIENLRSTPTLTISGTVAVTNLKLSDGTLAGTGISMASGGTITRTATGIWSGTAINSSGPAYNVTYTGSCTTGNELPSTATTVLNNLTISSGTVLLGNDATVNGTLTLASAFNSNAMDLELKGNLVSNSAPTFTTSILTFSGTTALSGSVSPTFGNVVITGTLTPSINYQVNGNLNSSGGTLNNGSVTTTFGGTSSVTGSPSFFNVLVANGGSFTPPATFTIGGTLINSGTFAATTTINLTGSFTNSASGVFTAPTNFSVGGALFLNNGTFTHNSGTVTFNATTSIGGTPTFNNIVVGGSGSVTPPATLTAAGNFTNGGTFNAGTTFNLAGNFTNNGTFNRGTGTVVFNGTSQQSISGSATSDFNNISVTNSTGGPPAVVVQSNQNLRGVLTLGANASLDADGSSNTSIFKLISTGDSPTADAGIATLPSGASVTGSVTVQRFMTIEGANNNRIYRFISAPVSSAPVSQIQTFLPVTGTFTGASSCTGCGTSQSMFSYDETVTTDTDGSTVADLNDGYINFPSATNATTFAVGRGYSIYVRGNIAPVSTAGNARWELRGPVNSGNISLPVTFTAGNGLSNDGWNLVGNPYPSTIDWDNGGWTRTNVDNATYMLDYGSVTPVYATYVSGAGANGGSKNIATGQAFFVKANAASPVLNLTEAVKLASTQTTYFREATDQKVIRIALQQGTRKDESVIRFMNESTDGFDSQWDAFKLSNPAPMYSLSSLGADNSKFAINSMAQLSCGSVVKLDISNVTSGSYSLSFSQLESFATAMGISLKDNYTGSSVDLRNVQSYDFSVDSNNPSTFGFGRFAIQLQLSGELPASINAVSNDICAGQDGKLSVKGSKLGTSYALLLNGKPVLDPIIGTGGDIHFMVPKGSFNAEVNTFEVKASSPACSAISISQNISVNKVSLPSVASVPGKQNCRAGAVLLSASGAPSSDGYRWYSSKDASEPIEGQTGASFMTPVLSKTKTYYVSAVNSLGCEGDRKEATAEIINYDDAVINMLDSLTLSSNYETGNQWYFEGKAIDGANGKTLKPEKSGIYSIKVDINASAGCTTEAEHEYVVNSVKGTEVIAGLEGDMPAHITIFPNPTNDVLSIAVKSTNQVSARLLTILGATLYGQSLEGTTIKRGSFNLQEQAEGMYILIVEDGGKTYKTRVIKKR